MKTIFLFLSVLCPVLMQAQIGMGTWKLHVATAKAIDVVASTEEVFTAYENGLSIYNIAEDDHRLLTALTGLSDIEISCLFYDEDQNAVYIGYTNGNIDKYHDGEISNIPAIKLAQISMSKRINHFVKKENYVYAANDFSIVQLDAIKDEVKETYYPTNTAERIVDLAIYNDSIYALTPTQLYKGYLPNPILPDFSQWVRDIRLPFQTANKYTEMELFQNRLVVLKKSDEYGTDTVYRINASDLEIVTNLPFSAEINSINTVEAYLSVNIDGVINMYNDNLQIPESYGAGNFSQWFSSSRTARNASGLWSADLKYGLLLYPTEVSFKAYPIDGSKNNFFYAMDAQKGKLAIASGRLDEGQPNFSRNGVHFYQDASWRLLNVNNVSAWPEGKTWDFIDVAINPLDTSEVATSSYSYSPLTLMNAQDTIVFDATNSVIKAVPGNGWSLVSDVLFDPRGNLWALNGFSDRPLTVRDKNGTWYNFDCGPDAKNKYTSKMIQDFNEILWFATKSDGVIGYQHHGTISDPSDDQYITIDEGAFSGNLPSSAITALAADFDGELWIGTESGFAILYNAAAAFDAQPGDYNAQQIKVNFEGNVEYVLGKTHITDIEVDGGNRKWMATANAGIILMSADGSEILEQHTMENSSIISNTIYDLQLNQETGELYIITDKGLVSYRTNASYEDPEYSDVKVFPNPVKPNYYGPVTIQGIRYDSDVKVTDIAGNLIYRTTSNGGTATWNGQNLHGEKVPSGVYLIWTATNGEGRDRKVGKVMVIR
ncbi:MAG: two-component regulator propeller domain-containing protein [Flavobacteriales bacterium]